jgi:hypothetical protein
MARQTTVAVRISRQVLSVLFVFALVFMLRVTPAKAQSSIAGTVTGQVTDESGAAVPGVAVKLADLSTNQAFSTVTNESGRYDFPTVPPGRYDVTFIKQGFSEYEMKGRTSRSALF